MNKKQDLKKIFEKASELVADVPDSVKSKAFEIAVSQMLKPESQEDKGRVKGSSQLDESRRGAKKSFFEKMSEELAVEVEELKTVFKLNKDNTIKVISPLKGSTAGKQRQLAFLYLLANKIGFEKEWVLALEFASQAKLHGINDGHTSDNLDKDEAILQSGKKRGKEYGLTPSGVAKAKEILQKLTKK